MNGELLKVIISLVFSAFFSAIEIAFISSNKLHIAVQKQKGTLTGRILDKFANRSSRFITTTLVGNTVSLVVYGMAMAEILERPIAQQLTEILPGEQSERSVAMLALVFQTIVSTIIVLATAEFTPKSISLANPYGFLKVMAVPMNIIYTLMLPITWVVDKLSERMITKGFRMRYQPNKPVLFGLADLSNYVQNTIKESTKTLTTPDINEAIFSNALEFKTIRVRDCMIPRKEIEAVSRDMTVEELKEAFIESGHSKLLVYEDSIDNIVGYCHMMGLFKKPQRIVDMMNEIIIVPETTLANELMVRFIAEHKSIALVVDEFGGTSGIVTIEDIVEEIFGEIEDEYDTEGHFFSQIDDQTFILSARHEIDLLNEQYGWEIPEGDYDTLGGFILAVNEDFPQIGDVISTSIGTIEVRSMQDARIDRVRIVMNSNTGGESAD